MIRRPLGLIGFWAIGYWVAAKLVFRLVRLLHSMMAREECSLELVRRGVLLIHLEQGALVLPLVVLVV